MVAAVVEEFAHVTMPARFVYLDTSVIVAAYRAAGQGARPEEIASRQFIQLLARTGSEVWTSLLAVEEACWVPFRSALRQRSQQAGYGGDWKRLKQRDPTAFSQAYQAARRRADPLMQFIRRLPVLVRRPRHPAPAGHRACRAVCYMARSLLWAHELEAADAFHIAIARVDGTQHIASLDAAFQDVDQITVYAHREF